MTQNIGGTRSHGPASDDLYRDAQAEQAGREWRDRHGGIQKWTPVVRRTQEQIEADWARKQNKHPASLGITTPNAEAEKISRQAG